MREHTTIGGWRRRAATLSAIGLVALAIPVGTASPAAAYDGFATEAWATPVRVEIYEPTIPIPAEPQAEFSLSFSRTRTQTGQLASLASYLWPGDAIGGGLKTFGEQLGLPGALTDGGYPVQVNAVHPGSKDVDEQRQEPFPGTVMRATAAEKQTRAQAGFALSDQVSEGDRSDGEAGGGGGLPGLPSLPGVPALPIPGLGGAATRADDSAPAEGLAALVDGLLSGGLLGALGGAGGGQAPGIPKELSLLIDIGGMSSTTRTTLGDDEVTTTARSALGDISIAAGLITLEGVTAVARTSGDGENAKASGTARIGALRIAGQLMAIDEGGISAAGSGFALPGLSGDPAKALEQLGIKISLPGVTRTTEDAEGSVSAEAIRVELDAVKLRGLLSIIPLATLTEALPAEAAELAVLLDTVANLSPRIVLVLGSAHSMTQTVPEFDFGDGGEATEPPAEDTPPGDGDGDAPPADAAPPGGDGGGGAGGGGDAAPPVDDAGVAPGDGDVEALPATQLTAGLPPLTTIPGLLTWGGIALGAAAGFWLRRMGLLVLGGGAACAHGFETGLPDLRKA